MILREISEKLETLKAAVAAVEGVHNYYVRLETVLTRETNFEYGDGVFFIVEKEIVLSEIPDYKHIISLEQTYQKDKFKIKYEVRVNERNIKDYI
jgi:hypothetical protein